MSPKKIAFFVLVAVIIVGLGIGLSMLSKTKKTDGTKGPKELAVWVVGDDTAGFDDIVKSFKSQDAYKNTNVVFTKFATYGDYEKSLLNVIADGNSPDVFVVPSGGASVLESKIEYLPESVVNVDEFSRTYNPLFDSLVVLEDSKNKEKKQSRFVKGIPMGYETMGVFYNRALVSNAVPATWNEFKEYVNGAGGQDFVPAALGLGSRYVPGAPSIASLFLVQNGIDSYSKLSESNAEKALASYQSYRGGGIGQDPVAYGLEDVKSDMDRQGIGAVDLFVRGKVGIVFGYPSLMREIAYAVKRSNGSSVLEKKDLRSSEVPQNSTGKKANLARYNYFALSKSAPNHDAATDFLMHLYKKESQESYLESFPQYLPARTELLDSRKERLMDKSYPWVRYENFIGSPDVELKTFDRGVLSEFESAMGKELDNNAESRTILTNVNREVECQKKHLIDQSGYEEACGGQLE